MVTRLVIVAVVAVGGALCVWGFSGSAKSEVPNTEPLRVTSETDCDSRDEAAARFRSNQSRHWRHIAVGNASN
jgi:hypothetical protein